MHAFWKAFFKYFGWILTSKMETKCVKNPIKNGSGFKPDFGGVPCVPKIRQEGHPGVLATVFGPPGGITGVLPKSFVFASVW